MFNFEARITKPLKINLYLISIKNIDFFKSVMTIILYIDNHFNLDVVGFDSTCVTSSFNFIHDPKKFTLFFFF